VFSYRKGFNFKTYKIENCCGISFAKDEMSGMKNDAVDGSSNSVGGYTVKKKICEISFYIKQWALVRINGSFRDKRL
jgi:hypothetical protein